MKDFVALAKRTINDRDGFFQGFLKGVAGSAVMLIFFSALVSFN